ncbi:MAG: autotransporter outer membrane beta-barrel domain-containing protein [Dongiaceae bacterium]
MDTDSFKENGALAALTSRGFDQNVGYSTLGLRAATTMHWGSALVTPHVSAAWQHAFDDITPGAALAFASTGIGFDITGVPLAEGSALIEAGVCTENLIRIDWASESPERQRRWPRCSASSWPFWPLHSSRGAGLKQRMRHSGIS